MIDARIVAGFDARAPFPLREATLLALVRTGSDAHGTKVPPADPHALVDVDLVGIVVPPMPWALGFPCRDWDGVSFWADELDCVFYSFRKYATLLWKSNPNVLGLLWGRPEDLVSGSPAWDLLLEGREAFSSRLAHETFAGYARGQLHRMASYTPEIDAEIRALEAELEAAGWRLQDVMDRRSVPMPTGLSADEAGAKAERLRTLRARYHSAYMGDKRRALVRTHGWDVKNGAHLIRLLSMCLEFLRTGVLHVNRSGIDAEELKAIKRGERTLEDVKADAERLFTACEEALPGSPLPAQPDLARIDRILLDVYLECYGLQSNHALGYTALPKPD